MRMIMCFIVLVLTQTLSAQPREPDFSFRFTPASPDSGLATREGRFEVSILPPQLDTTEPDNRPAVPATLFLQATVYPGRWLTEAVPEAELSEEERFVAAKFRLFQNADQSEQYRPWLDAETFARFAGSVEEGAVDLASDRDFYGQFDAIRLLGSVQYGVYTLLYTQFRPADSSALVAAVMPVRRIEQRLVTAGGLHAESHELYRMLAFGTLQRRLMDYLEASLQNEGR